MIALAPRDAYRLWAPTYHRETAISFLDEKLTIELSPDCAGKRLLDAGCGVGRRLPANTFAVGVDLSEHMLAAGGAASVAVADVRNLPFADGEFEIAWCRLVLGHLPDLGPAYAELARVCRPAGHVLVTDFHPDATAAGHTRTFRDDAGIVREVEHHVHDRTAHAAAATTAGLNLVAQRDGVIGERVEPFYARAGRSELYERDKGLAVVAAFLFRRTD
jgi:malonyl-CoA O-methyltransferase